MHVLLGTFRGTVLGVPRSNGPCLLQDSFKSCTSFTAAVHILQILVPDLLVRLREDYEVIINAAFPDFLPNR